ncbi:MAG: L-threonylcarbamoyladenylate synthase [Polaribacter sp.]|nr:L-threonylcarbamoyladenylate synthase [Polaribacter sp.]
MATPLQTALDALQAGKTILYPTDTVWGIGCDATDEKAVAKIYKIKQRKESKSLIVLVDSLEMLLAHVAVPEKTLQIIKKTTRPTTIIYPNPRGLAANVIAADNTVAIRIVQGNFCAQLIAQFRKPIVSTSANSSGEMTPKSFKEIGPAILESVDYIVNLHQEKITHKSSTILKIENDEVVVIRD